MTTTLFAAITVTDEAPLRETAIDYPIHLSHTNENNTTLITISTTPELYPSVVDRVKLVLAQLL